MTETMQTTTGHPSPEPAAQEPSERSAETRRFRVFRFKRGDAEPHFDTFDVPIEHRTTVFEALRWIQLNRDPSLSLRHSCLHASCGTCGLQVNGREALACVTFVRDLGHQITVEPIANIPVLTDLVVDMTEFYARFPDQHPYLRSSEFLPQADTPDGIGTYVRFENCIECGLCLSACPIAATSDAYVGPAALAAAERLLEEPRGADLGSVLDWADRPDGVWRCHAAFECTEACPSNVEPAARIMALRGELVGGRLRGGQREDRG
ncbi:MAG TPA: 2Fe-2S iron-sulfur cluster-binding protein [Actinomycetota bacterium]|jgi:succinate dehydrogenase / fumarate reductase iron-sulfur subunit|nr:2Fe-2S iron-sulfur cluster-binding protein [Actinomycetota bacterium]